MEIQKTYTEIYFSEEKAKRLRMSKHIGETEILVSRFASQKQFAKGNKIASIQAKQERQLNWIDVKAERKAERKSKRKVKYAL